MKIKSIKHKVFFYIALISFVVLLISVANLNILNQIRQKNDKLLNVAISTQKINEMKEAFKAKQADVGWFLHKDNVLNSGDETNHAEEFNEHMGEVDETKELLKKYGSEFLNKEDLDKLESMNTSIDRAFLQGIKLDVNTAGNIKIFRESIDAEDELTDKLAEQLNEKYNNIQSEIVSFEKKAIGLIIILIAALVIFLLVIGYFFSSSLSKPISNVADILTKVASGDLSNDVEVNGLDEVGKLQVAAKTMINDLKQIIAVITKGASDISSSVQEVTAYSEEITSSSEQVTNSIQNISTNAHRQVVSVLQAGSSVSDLSSSINTISRGAQSVSAESKKAFETAEVGRTSIGKAIDKMGKINEKVKDSAEVVKHLGDRSKEIGNIIGVISQIAEQTNLLALNAAIEAARAGEQGKGFAVVAEEVRKLAEQSSKAAKDISSLIQATQSETEEAVAIIIGSTSEVGEGLNVMTNAEESFKKILVAVQGVNAQVQQINKSIETIAASSSQMVPLMNELSAGADSISESTTEVAAASEEQTATLTQINANNGNLSNLAISLQNVVQKFKL